MAAFQPDMATATAQASRTATTVIIQKGARLRRGGERGVSAGVAGMGAKRGGWPGVHLGQRIVWCRDLVRVGLDATGGACHRPGMDGSITPDTETRLRQHLLLVALGKEPADTALRVGRMLDVHTRSWREDWEIVMQGGRIAFTGPAGSYPGQVGRRVERPGLAAVPGFGEVHKHIESSHLTPEWEAALVLPRGNTWTCEASHEFSNVDGVHNLEFWLEARRRGSPLKIFPLPGSAVPPTAYEWGGGWYGGDEQAGFMADTLMVPGLDEVMDWPAVWNPANPSYGRLWGMIGATIAARGVVEGHGAGLRDLPSINAFAAAGLASDHEVMTVDEVWDKLSRGLFVEIRIYNMAEIVAGLLARGLADWSQVAFTTDDRSASDTLRRGATDANVRAAIAAGLAPEVAIQCVTINPARHMRLTPYVGSIAPGRFADLVLLSDVAGLGIAEVWADGAAVSEGSRFLGAVPEIAWPGWATGHDQHPAGDHGGGFRGRGAGGVRGFGAGHGAGGGAAAVPLASGLPGGGAAGGGRAGAAGRRAEHHEVRHRGPVQRGRADVAHVLARVRAADGEHGAGVFGGA